jgi:(1->4)-alpha-D-glucan 1-alpha-D-glucosylmutase
MMAALRVPVATYRLQLHAGFRFADAEAIVPYLHALGASDLYASPVLQARAGSTHGYDTTDPRKISADLGGEEGLRALATALGAHGMGLLLDVVPNHMAASGENPWWHDVLERGADSPYARYFDVEWEPSREGRASQVVLPVLGAPYARVLEAGELRVALDAEGLAVRYYDWRLPLRPASYGAVLALGRERLAERPGAAPEPDALRELAEGFAQAADADRAAFAALRARLWQLYESTPTVREFLDATLGALNGRSGDPSSFDGLDDLLAAQAYQLAYWRVASRELNYRRFFDVSDLVSVRVEDQTVFDATHATVLRLVAEGIVSGLRIDHVDGLYDPAAYVDRLQARLSADNARAPAARAFYVLVEKILAADEALPATWPVDGTTGYEFLNLATSLAVDGRATEALDELYARITGDDAPFAEVAHAQKRRVIADLFGGEARALAARLGRLAPYERHGRDVPVVDLEAALVEVAACLSVYRTYVRGEPVAPTDRERIERAVAAAVARQPALGPAGEFLRRVLLLAWPADLAAEGRAAWLDFVMRWQQFTGPATAKGVEDTALYRYPRLLALNDVGGDPGAPVEGVAGFHRRLQERQARWPHTMNATSTHDTKRSEDVRARLAVLSEIPRAWAARLERWRQWNAPKSTRLEDGPVPDGAMELLLYQSLLGAWPLDDAERPAFRGRFRDYLVKAAREAKHHTSWHDPRTDYEQALLRFADAVLDPPPGDPFHADFRAFQRPIAYYGALSSLAQVLLKTTAPGVPDFYQGTELWDFSLVDPDNRRPVDYARRAALLAALPDPGPADSAATLPDLGRADSATTLADPERADPAAAISDLLACWEDGRVKLYLTRAALRCRQAHAALFAAGDYAPVAADGPQAEHVCAFARQHAGTTILVVAPRLMARLALDAQEAGRPSADDDLPPLRLPLGEATWHDTTLRLPAGSPARWRNALTGECLVAAGSSLAAVGDDAAALRLADVLRLFPVGLLVGEE